MFLRWLWWETLAADVRQSVRGFAKVPGFTLTVLTALALGIGANTAVFTVVKTVLLNPLPYPEADRIVSVGAQRQEGGISEPIFTFWERNNPGFEDLAAYHSGARMNLSGGDRPELVETVAASRNYFRLFGATLALGRPFSAAESSPGGPRALVISYDLWRNRFGGSAAILGKTMALGGMPYTVTGVLSPNFEPYPPADAWIPLQADPNSTNYAGILTVAARLPKGVTLAQANARLLALRKRWTRSLLFYKPAIRFSFLQQQLTGNVRPALLILLGAVALVLLIACSNVANLLLARSTARRREIAIRAAIGAPRSRIVRQLLTESILLALGGATFGLVLGSWGVKALLALTPGDLPRLREIAAFPALDPPVAWFTLALALLTGVLFGLAPVFQLAGSPLTASLNESGGRIGPGRSQSRTHGVLVSAEAALAVVLLCGAVLLIRSFATMHSEKLGFDANRLLTIEISLAGPGYSKSSAVDRIAREFSERAARIPGVESTALASALPLFGKMDMIFTIPGRTPPTGHLFNGDVQWRFVSARYFDVLGMPLVAGRLLRDGESGRTVVISQTMARRFWPGTNAVGQTIFIGPGLGSAYQVGLTEIVGVVGDVRERLDIRPQPVMYQLPSQIPDGDMALLNGYEPTAILVRTLPGVAPVSVSHEVQRALLSQELPVGKVRTMKQTALDSTARQNFNLLLLGLFAAIALLLAAVGIYGVMSYSVQQRTHEIGVRSALGASPRQTIGRVLGQALRMTLAGTAVGVGASFGLTGLLGAQLFGVKPLDPVTFTTVPGILIAVALAAACVPALRASRVDPIVALRQG